LRCPLAVFGGLGPGAQLDHQLIEFVAHDGKK
jgi:hypothetical protein